MDIWSLLSIKPTHDVVLIKRAYAGQLKFYHPEEDPEGFQHLRSAYEAALREAKLSQKHDEPHTEFMNNRNADEIPEYNERFNDRIENELQFQVPTMNLSGALASQFLDQVVEIYDDIKARFDINNWRTILEDEKYTGIETRQLLQIELLKLFMDRPWAPGSVWRLLNDTFAWSSMEIQLQHIFSNGYLDYVLKQLEGFWDLGYNSETVVAYSQEQVDTFLSVRYRAQAALIQGDIEIAGQWLQEAAEIIPDDPDTNRMIGEYWLRLENWEEALLTYKRMEAFSEDEANFSNELAYTMFQLGHFEDAHAAYERILAHSPDDFHALTGLAQCLEKLNRDIEAKGIFLRINKLCPWDVHTHIQLIVLNQKFERKLKQDIELRQFQSCINVIQQLEELGDLTPWQSYILAFALHKMDQYDKAALYYKVASDGEPDDVSFQLEIQYQMGINAIMQLDNPSAFEYFERALAIDPQHMNTLYYKAELLKETENYEEAENSYKLALMNGDNRLYHAGLASCYFYLQRNEECVYHFNKALLDEESDTVYYSEYGNALIRLGKGREAIQMFDVVIQRSEVEVEIDKLGFVFYNKAGAHYMLKEYELCRTNMQTFLNYVDHELQLYANYLSGKSSFFLKDWNSAAASCAEMLKHDPGEQDKCSIVKVLAATLLAARRFTEALNPLEEVLRLEKNNEWAMLQIVRVYAELKDWERIEKAMERYLETFKQEARNPYIWFYGGIFFYYINNYIGAAKFLKIAYQSGLRGDTCSYYSLVLNGMGERQAALTMAREALQDRPGHPDYDQRLKYIEGQLHKRNSLFKRLTLYLDKDKSPSVRNLDFPDILGDPQLRENFPEEVIINE